VAAAPPRWSRVFPPQWAQFPWPGVQGICTNEAGKCRALHRTAHANLVH